MRVADYIANRVAATGSDAVFMLTGGMMMHLMDAFGRVPSMKYYCNHHEQASAMAADGYARQTGKLGVCLATSGPGATNLLTGLVGAYQDSIPILFLTGQCKRAETVRLSGIPGLRQKGFLEVDIVPVVTPVTKYAAFVESPERVRYHLEKALHLALSGRPGPVLLDVPLDVQGAQIEPDSLEGFTPEGSAVPVDRTEVEALLARLRSASRPVVVAGHGIRCAGMSATFRSLADGLGIPVVTTAMAKDLMPYKHPLFVGHPGPRGDRPANFAVQSADLLLFLGSSLHIMTTGYETPDFAPRAEKIQIDVDEPLLRSERVGAAAKYCWDLKEFLPLFDCAVRRGPATAAPLEWRDRCASWKREFPVIDEPHHLGEADDPVNLYEYLYLMGEQLRGHETLLTDAGQPFWIVPQSMRMKEGVRYLIAGSFAEMGWALPAALGVAAGDPERQVIAIIGDGSLQTNIQELQTLAHHRFNIKLFVVNNGGYLSIRNTQKSFFNGYFVGSTEDSGVSLPGLEKIAGAYGIPFVRSECRSAAPRRIREVLAMEGPVICEVMNQYDQKLIPSVPSFMLPDGRMKSKALHEMAPDLGERLRDTLQGFVN